MQCYSTGLLPGLSLSFTAHLKWLFCHRRIWPWGPTFTEHHLLLSILGVKDALMGWTYGQRWGLAAV